MSPGHNGEMNAESRSRGAAAEPKPPIRDSKTPLPRPSGAQLALPSQADSDGPDNPVTVRNSEGISLKLREFLGDHKIKQIADDTGFHHESVRRYMRGASTIPAEFIGAVCGAYGLDAVTILLEGMKPPYRQNPRETAEDRLAESLAETLEPHMKEWLRGNVVPFGMFLRPPSAQPISRDVERGERTD